MISFLQKIFVAHQTSVLVNIDDVLIDGIVVCKKKAAHSGGLFVSGISTYGGESFETEACRSSPTEVEAILSRSEVSKAFLSLREAFFVAFDVSKLSRSFSAA